MFSLLVPLIAQPNSSAAIRAASSEPRPDAVDSGPFISAITPIFITSSEICAFPDDARQVAKARATQNPVARRSFLTGSSPLGGFFVLNRRDFVGPRRFCDHFE